MEMIWHHTFLQQVESGAPWYHPVLLTVSSLNPKFKPRESDPDYVRVIPYPPPCSLHPSVPVACMLQGATMET
ncbi:UNVERIFIED_CONTAM: hypothetical protein GTU68_056309 [Idotea baltica]|nr:hypothetical protein [Idotea baltica]